MSCYFILQMMILLLLLFIDVNSTREQLDAMHVPMKSRDLCVDFLVMLHRCRASFGTSPFVCLHEKHQMEQCAYELMKHESQKQFGSH